MTGHYEFTDDWFSVHIPNFQQHLGHLDGTPCQILEVGSYDGRSTTWIIDNLMSHPNSRLDTVDLNVVDILRDNVEKTGRSEQVTVHEGPSIEVLRHLPSDHYDFIYLDGSHAAIEVIQDAVSAFRLAKVGCVIGFDDYEWDQAPWNWYGTPKPAIDAILDIYAHSVRHEPLLEILGTGWQIWVKKVRSKPEQLTPPWKGTTDRRADSLWHRFRRTDRR